MANHRQGVTRPSARSKAVASVALKHPQLLLAEIARIVDDIPTDVLQELHDERLMNGEAT